jgi:hypothetical protein
MIQMLFLRIDVDDMPIDVDETRAGRLYTSLSKSAFRIRSSLLPSAEYEPMYVVPYKHYRIACRMMLRLRLWRTVLIKLFGLDGRP